MGIKNQSLFLSQIQRSHRLCAALSVILYNLRWAGLCPAAGLNLFQRGDTLDQVAEQICLTQIQGGRIWIKPCSQINVARNPMLQETGSGSMSMIIRQVGWTVVPSFLSSINAR